MSKLAVRVLLTGVDSICIQVIDHWCHHVSLSVSCRTSAAKISPLQAATARVPASNQIKPKLSRTDKTRHPASSVKRLREVCVSFSGFGKTSNFGKTVHCRRNADVGGLVGEAHYLSPEVVWARMSVRINDSRNSGVTGVSDTRV